MSIETNIYDTLRNDASVAGEVSTRIYPENIPQGATFPAITYNRSGNNPQYDLVGETNLFNPQFAIDIWAESYSDARTVAEYVKIAMNGESSLFSAVLIAEFEIYEDNTGIHHVSLDYSIWHS